MAVMAEIHTNWSVFCQNTGMRSSVPGGPMAMVSVSRVSSALFMLNSYLGVKDNYGMSPATTKYSAPRQVRQRDS